MPWIPADRDLYPCGFRWARDDEDPVTEMLPPVPPLPRRVPGATELPPKPEPEATLDSESEVASERPHVDDPVLTQPAPLPHLLQSITPHLTSSYDNTDEGRTMLTTREFWAGAGERAAKSLAQCLLGLWLADGFDLLQVDWQHSLGVAAGAAVLSVLTSIASAGVGPTGSPSLVDDQPGRHALDGQGRDGVDEVPARRLFDPERDR